MPQSRDLGPGVPRSIGAFSSDGPAVSDDRRVVCDPDLAGIGVALAERPPRLARLARRSNLAVAAGPLSAQLVGGALEAGVPWSCP